MLARRIRLAVLLLLPAAGCCSPFFALPNLLHPGPIADQQARTERTMAVADTNLFTAASGILPPGYIPRAEVQQSRNVIPNPWFEQNKSYYRRTGPRPGVYRPRLISASGGDPAASAAAAASAPQAAPSFY